MGEADRHEQEDEQARKGRPAAPPARRAEVTGEERARLIVGCADAVLAWRGVYGAADSLIRGLAERLGISAGEAEALVLAEQARRR